MQINLNAHFLCTTHLSVIISPLIALRAKLLGINLAKASQEGLAVKFPLNCISLNGISTPRLDQISGRQLLLRRSCNVVK